MARDPFDVSGMGLSELGERNEFLEGQVSELNRGARAEGGVGSGRRDEQAREFSRKQTAVEGEIFDRLSRIHEDRSMRSQELDESLKAPIAEAPEQWASDPSQFDWPGIDTPPR
jgi:hypothetical protein